MTAKLEIEQWFDKGVASGHKYMIVVVDTYDWEDYPVYCETDRECLKKYAEYNGMNMQRVMEVYNLQDNKQVQLNEYRCFRLPTQPASDM